MKDRGLLLMQGITGFLTGILLLCEPIPVFAEEIRSYSGDYSIQADGVVTVEEKIEYDFGIQSRHGIFRTIPYIKSNTDEKKFVLDISGDSVTDENGSTYTYSKSVSDGSITFKIGDPDTTITGIHLYDIRYTVAGALTYYSDHDEFYWNVTGNGWDYPIGAVQARVRLPSGVLQETITASCFTGAVGSTESDCTATVENSAVAIRTTRQLSGNEGLTVVVGFPKNIVARLEPKPYVSFWETPAGIAVLVVLLFLGIAWYFVLPVYIGILWLRRGRDPKPIIGTASSWFDPPKTQLGRRLSPGETGTLVDERADMRDVTATIIDLARRGYLRILESKKGEFHFERATQSGSSGALQKFEEVLLGGIFENAELINLKSTSLASAVEKTKNALYETVVAEGFFPKNPQSTRTGFTVLSIFGLLSGNILLFISSLLFGLNMPRKTQSGSDATAIAKSLRNFLESQERHLEFQAKNQLFFEKLLPYAIAFGVERIWAKRFSDIAMKQPEWYQGYSTGRFNSVLLVDSIIRSNAGFVSAATPTSSSSGFSSGFSGGSSGGGGGGGGGGSW